ncbi:cytochrome o ubiquinol oxidase subunit IV [Palleronia abyssalis]|uniref:Cytochrome bo(3) ubiquinol oxidase subunit 4 n=1 Tax=Palleronia abyssalis TaxID=1501240 RepID=A0A2R8C1W3_9RHOB|nr:cytochrome o ubiquinol oxidase subunit IV [Palleronia abyssalis]SPJ26370.1 Cytochrome bo(3) ubiquinol oxidase subunit 4 [Palleronia abyssalis]
MRDISDEERAERRQYTLGLILSIVLTAASFGIVILDVLPRGWVIPAIIVLALAQIVVHLRIFLHIDLTRQKREDLQLLLFTLLLLGIMAFGTLWILANLADRM